MSATMARQGGQVQLEQSDMCHTLNMARMANVRLWRAAIEEMRHLINKPHTDVRQEQNRGVEFSRHKTVKVAIETHPELLCQTTWMADFLPKLALQIIHQYARGAKAPVHIHPTNTDSRHQKQLNLSPECHLCYPVQIRELKLSNSTMCHLDMCIHILLFPSLKFSIWMHILRVASNTQMLIQICWVMTEHPLVSTLSPVS